MDVLVENLRAAFREGIDGLEWMGPETRKEAHAKLAAFRPKIGYPSKWRDYSKIEIRTTTCSATSSAPRSAVSSSSWARSASRSIPRTGR